MLNRFIPSVLVDGISDLLRYREDILPYLTPATNGEAVAAQQTRWTNHPQAVDLTGRALTLFLAGQSKTPQFQGVMAELNRQHPSFAPAAFLRQEYERLLSQEPRLLDRAAFALLNDQGAETVVEISAVYIPAGQDRASIAFVDNDARVIYGERYFEGPGRDAHINTLVRQVMTDIRSDYQSSGGAGPRKYPPAGPTLTKIKDRIRLRIENPR